MTQCILIGQGVHAGGLAADMLARYGIDAVAFVYAPERHDKILERCSDPELKVVAVYARTFVDEGAELLRQLRTVATKQTKLLLLREGAKREVSNPRLGGLADEVFIGIPLKPEDVATGIRRQWFPRYTEVVEEPPKRKPFTPAPIAREPTKPRPSAELAPFPKEEARVPEPRPTPAPRVMKPTARAPVATSAPSAATPAPAPQEPPASPQVPTVLGASVEASTAWSALIAKAAGKKPQAKAPKPYAVTAPVCPRGLTVREQVLELRRLLQAPHPDRKAIGASFGGKSAAWVYHYECLGKLCDPVLDLLPDFVVQGKGWVQPGRLSVSNARLLVDLSPEMQLKAAQHIAREGLHLIDAQEYVEALENRTVVTQKPAELPVPRTIESFTALADALSVAADACEALLVMPKEELQDLLRRSPQKYAALPDRIGSIPFKFAALSRRMRTS